MQESEEADEAQDAHGDTEENVHEPSGKRARAFQSAQGKQGLPRGLYGAAMEGH